MHLVQKFKIIIPILAIVAFSSTNVKATEECFEKSTCAVYTTIPFAEWWSIQV